MSVTPRRRFEVLKRDGFRCTYCGLSTTALEVDHVIPRAAGGTDDDGNLVTACRDCNRGKSCIEINGTRPPDDLVDRVYRAVEAYMEKPGTLGDRMRKTWPGKTWMGQSEVEWACWVAASKEPLSAREAVIYVTRILDAYLSALNEDILSEDL